MGMQKEILTKTTSTTAKKKEGTSVVDANISGGVGTLALGKVGDIIARAYGPVTRAYVIEDNEVAFGTYVEGKGILVNPNDCAGFSKDFTAPFDAKKLLKGQIGTFLVSGACVILKSQFAAIAAGMKVQYIDQYDYTHSKDTDVIEIEVNGFDNDVPTSSSL